MPPPAARISELFSAAAAHHGAGRLADAEALYREILAADPTHDDSLHLLGMVAYQSGRSDVAVELIRRAIALNGRKPAFHLNLGSALSEQGELAAASASFRAALALNPHDPEAHLALGNALHAAAAQRSGIGPDFNSAAQPFQGVRAQYESLPFPARDPEAERHLMLISVPDTLSKVNQYCFGGARAFSKGLRVLVAGAGTGDSVMWLAHQLQGTPSEIVALDISAASLDIAKARADVRGFKNIRWIHASLLDLPTLGLGTFDYITCLGVLHHLPDPEAGLAALQTVLAEDGGMAVMVYGTHGRSFIYGMQDLLRRLSVGLHDPGERLRYARAIVETLPPTNPFKFRYDAKSIEDYFLHDNTNFWDLLLHEQDRSYTVSEVRSFLGSAGLSVQAFATYLGDEATCSLQYDLDTYIADAGQRARLKSLSESAREDIAEKLDGSLALHTVYAARSPKAALDPKSPQAILSVKSEAARQALHHPAASGAGVPVGLGNGQVIVWQPSATTRAFLAGIDGRRSNAEIARSLDAANERGVLAQVAPDLRLPLAFHWLVARTSSGTAWPAIAGYRRISLPLKYQEPIHLEPAGCKAFTPL